MDNYVGLLFPNNALSPLFLAILFSFSRLYLSEHRETQLKGVGLQMARVITVLARGITGGIEEIILKVLEVRTRECLMS